MKVFVTRSIPTAGIDKLRAAGHEVVIGAETGELARDEFISKLQTETPDAVLCLLTDRIDDEIFTAAPQVKIFANYAVGYDNMDVEASKQHGVVLTNTPDVLTNAVAEYAAALTLSLAKRVQEADRFLRDGRYTGWDPLLLLGMELSGKTFGSVGGGRIGRRTAEIMHHGFGMKIAYFDRGQNQDLDRDLSATYVPELADLLATADILSIHLPLTAETRHLINKETLASMKPSALLINTARGPIIDEAALAEALQNKVIAGAGLDVFENEPDVHPDLLGCDNVIITPHIASATTEARDRMSEIAADNIIAVLNDQLPLTPVS